jgi:acyl dehydratase
MGDLNIGESIKNSAITDEDIALQKMLIGLDEVNRGREFHTTLSGNSIRNYAESIGDDNPLFTDSEYGITTRWGSQIAPQIMMAIINTPLKGKRLPKEVAAKTRGLFKGCQTFVSGGTWNWYRPIFPGDTLYSFEGEESMEVKPSEFGGRTVHITHRYVKFNQRAEVVGVYRMLRILAERKKAKEKGKYTEIEPANYSKEAVKKIDSAYLQEQCRGGNRLIWEEVGVGDSLLPLQKGPLTVTDIILAHCAGYGLTPYRMLATSRIAAKDRVIMPNLYSANSQGVLDTAARVHWEHELAVGVGNPMPYDWGLQREFWLHHALTDWMGDEGFVVSQKDEIRKFNYIGDLQTITGHIVNKYQRDGMNLVDVELIASNQRDEKTAIAEATIALPSKDRGLGVLPVVPEELQQKAIEFMAEHNRLKAR